MSTAEAFPMSSVAAISGLEGDGRENEDGRDNADSSVELTCLGLLACLVWIVASHSS